MKVVIIGGVAGGMSAAARLRRLDESAEIIVLERNRYVSFANCGLPYHIGGDIEERDSLLVVKPEQLRANLSIDVRTGHMVTEIVRPEKRVKVIDVHTGRPYSESYDKLVLAQGAASLKLPIPGSDHPRIFTLQNHHRYGTPSRPPWMAGPELPWSLAAAILGLRLRRRSANVAWKFTW